MPDEPWSRLANDPEFEGAAARARDTWRTDQEDATGDAYVAFRRGRTFVDFVRESMARGDDVEIRCTPLRFHGRVIAVGSDLVSIQIDDAPRVDLQFRSDWPYVMRVRTPAAHPGRSGGDSERFVARLVEREYTRAEQWVWIAGDAEPQRGRVEVAADAVRICGSDGGEILVAIAAVVAVQSAQ